jgi:hypothetical protein
MPIQFQDYFVLSVKFTFYVKDVAKIIYCGEKTDNEDDIDYEEDSLIDDTLK